MFFDTSHANLSQIPSLEDPLSPVSTGVSWLLRAARVWKCDAGASLGQGQDGGTRVRETREGLRSRRRSRGATEEISALKEAKAARSKVARVL